MLGAMDRKVGDITMDMRADLDDSGHHFGELSGIRMIYGKLLMGSKERDGRLGGRISDAKRKLLP